MEFLQFIFIQVSDIIFKQVLLIERNLPKQPKLKSFIAKINDTEQNGPIWNNFIFVQYLKILFIAIEYHLNC
jgi:hypothetical protein